MSKLKDEIGQARPFSSIAEEALLNLLRTADCLQRTMQRATRAHGITGTQYNVLRILRGAPPQGLTCSAIGDRMITADPDITRLLSRLKAIGLIHQQRDKRDRRVVWTQISPAGLALLSELDPMVQEMPVHLLGHIGPADLNRLVELLERARQHCGDTRLPVSCDGKGKAGESACNTPTTGQS